MMSIGSALLADTIKPRVKAVVDKYLGQGITAELVEEMAAELAAMSTPQYTISLINQEGAEMRVDIRIHLPSLEGTHHDQQD